MNVLPRHLRFARAVALLSGLGACGSSAPPPAPAPAPPVVASGGERRDPCSRCVCGVSTNPPSCESIGSYECCGGYAIEGPLPPPDLALG